MVAVQTDVGGFSIFENINHEDFDLGDQVSWENDFTLGYGQIKNISKGFIADVYFQNHHVSKSNIQAQLREE